MTGLAALLAAALVASAQTPLPLDPLPAALYVEARDREDAGDLEGAERRYRAVLGADPTFAPAALDLGRVRQARGDLSGAAEAYALAPPGDVDALAALGRVLLLAGRVEEAARTFERLRVYDTESAEPLRWLAEATLAIDPVRAEGHLRDWLGAHDPGRDPGAGAETAGRVADALRAAGNDDAARLLLEDAARALPDAPDDAWGGRLEQLLVEAEARRLARTAAQPLEPSQRERLVAARGRLDAADASGARTVLEGLLAEAPRSPEVWDALADVHEAAGDVAAADTALQTAEALAPFDPRYPARLGDLLADGYAGTEDAAAADAYGRALALDPTWADLWWRRGEVALRGGDQALAVACFGRYVDLAPEGPHASEARAVQGAVGRVRPPPPDVPRAAGCDPDIPIAACEAFWIAVAWQKRGEPAKSLAALEGVSAQVPGFVRAINLEASLRLQQGDVEAAVALYERSLAADPSQDLPLVLLWELLRAQGRPDEAREALARAEAHGTGVAQYLLARDAWESWRPLEARRRLDAYFASEGSGRYDERARDLAASIDRVRRRVTGFGAATLLGVLGVVPIAWVWRRAGVGVDALLARSPHAWRDVARIGSAIRHEVLKHHATLLPAVADALDEGDREPAAWAADRLFGAEGAIDRFRQQVRTLERVGRVHGVALNLRRADPTFGPLIVAMDRLEALEPELRRGEGRGLSDRVRAVAAVLVGDGYRRLGALVRRVCLLRLDEALVREAWRRAVAETTPDPSEAPSFHADVPPEPVLVRVWRGDLDDVLVNVLRNALAAGATRVGVRVAIEADAVTGIERVAVRLADDVPARLTTAVIRGRYIERGLGLVVDAISRDGGSIHVEPEPGWAKAVVVRWPRAEAPEIEAAEPKRRGEGR